MRALKTLYKIPITLLHLISKHVPHEGIMKKYSIGCTCYSRAVMEQSRGEKNIYELFRISVLLKGGISVAEIIVGIVAFFVPISVVTDLVASFAKAELAESPGSFIASHVLTLAQDASLVSGTFIALYLLTRGLIKLVLVWALLKNQLWAYPSSLVVLGLFVLYQLYQIVTGHSIVVVAITLFDLTVMYFIWREYKIMKAYLLRNSA